MGNLCIWEIQASVSGSLLNCLSFVRLDSPFLVSALQGACADCQDATWLEQSQKQILDHVWHLGFCLVLGGMGVDGLAALIAHGVA